MVLINLLIFVGGLLLLVKGADLFVEASTSIAKRFGISELVIGLTLVSVGTSVPELASSLIASFQQASGIVIGNILGSNIANTGLIVSTAALLSSVRTEKLMLKRDGYLLLFSTFLLFVFILDFEISRLEALFFLLLYIAYLLFLLDKTRKHEKDLYFKDFFIYFLRFEYLSSLKVWIKTRILEQRAKSRTQETNIDLEAEDPSKSSPSMEFFKFVGSGAAIIIGANYLVEQAIFFAQLLEVPETLIGLSLIAIGTSIPELMVTLSASYRGYAGIAVGNVIGSNITNILLILGCSGLVNPIIIGRLSAYYIAPFLLILSSLFLIFIRTGWRIKKFEGLMLLLLYSGFMISIFQL